MAELSLADKLKNERKMKKEILRRELALVQDVVKQNKMVTLNESDFFARFRLTQKSEIDVVGSGGIDDETGEPTINVPSNSQIWYDKERTRNLHRSISASSERQGYGPNSTSERVLDAYKEGKWLYIEYYGFHKDPEIGDCVVTSTDEMIRVLLCHEMAHCLQFWNCEPGYLDHERGGTEGHGGIWKRDYRILRRALGLVRR